MGKYEKGTPKEIANRCKSKGLQKLRWFCQMCQKQCRDQNGFKCHLTSEAHQRQLLLFAENPDDYLKDYSRNFESNFLRVLRSTFGTKRVRANEVYQEYIRDKMHVHMNSTTWHTLTNFVQYLGSSGKCKIDLTEKGWFIALIDQEEELRKQEAAHRVKVDLDDEQKLQEMLERQAVRAKELLGEENDKKSQPTELLREPDGEKVVFSLGLKKPSAKELSTPPLSSAALLLKENVKKEIGYPGSSNEMISEEKAKSDSKSDKSLRNQSIKKESPSSRKDLPGTSKTGESYRKRKGTDSKPKTALEEIVESELRQKERKMRKDYWVCEGIVVKVMTRKLGDKYYKAKGVVKSLVDKYTANVDVNGDLLKLDQDYLETVIPAEGRTMLIVNGLHSGKKATLEFIDIDHFCVKLRLEEGPQKGKSVFLPYEDASKLET